jgi:dienelactone hydrolase
MLFVLAAAAFGFSPISWDATNTVDIQYKGEKRLYHIILPQNYTDQPAIEFPAVVMLHGNGDNASVFAATNTLTQKAPGKGFAVIYPEGVQDPAAERPTRERSWNAGTCCGEALLNKVDDMTFLRTTLKHVTSNFRIDPASVFLSGHSNGGSLVLRAACELGGDYFAGTAANVGSFEPVRGEHCATKCTPNDDGNYYCAWDQTRPGCTPDDWISSLPAVFKCNRSKYESTKGEVAAPIGAGPRNGARTRSSSKPGPLPMLLFNGNQARSFKTCEYHGVVCFHTYCAISE